MSDPATNHQVPLPRRYRGKDLPCLLGSRETGEMLEFWGFTRNGREMVRKLVNAGRLSNAMTEGRWMKFETQQVLLLWLEMKR